MNIKYLFPRALLKKGYAGSSFDANTYHNEILSVDLGRKIGDTLGNRENRLERLRKVMEVIDESNIQHSLA